MSENFRVVGLDAALRKIGDKGWIRRPAGRFMDRWMFATERTAKANIKRWSAATPLGWIDTGMTRRSITSERDQSAFPQWAKVGSNQDTARWGEYGTGLLSEDPDSSHRRYFPPPSALARWAKKRDLDPFLVSRAIYLAGGTKPRRFLRDAKKDSDQRMRGWLGQFAGDIEREANLAA